MLARDTGFREYNQCRSFSSNFGIVFFVHVRALFLEGGEAARKKVCKAAQEAERRSALHSHAYPTHLSGGRPNPRGFRIRTNLTVMQRDFGFWLIEKRRAAGLTQRE